MGITHLSIYDGQATRIDSGTAFPTNRDAEHMVGVKPELEDGDWFYITTTDVLGIRIGSTWNLIEFTSTE